MPQRLMMLMGALVLAVLEVDPVLTLAIRREKSIKIVYPARSKMVQGRSGETGGCEMAENAAGSVLINMGSVLDARRARWSGGGGGVC